jgi:hypothetical protein
MKRGGGGVASGARFGVGVPETEVVSTAKSSLLAARFSTVKPVIFRGLPLSKSWKSDWVRSPMTRPWESRTTAGTMTELTETLMEGLRAAARIGVVELWRGGEQTERRRRGGRQPDVGCGPCYVSDCNTKWRENHLLGLHGGMVERAGQHNEGALRRRHYTCHYVDMP